MGMFEINLFSTQWRHKEKGGVYDVEFTAAGSGQLHGDRLVIYSDTMDRELYARKLSEWHEKMERIGA